MADEANGQANAMRRDTHMHTETHTHTDSIIDTDTVIWVAAGQKSKPKIQKKARKKERRNQINIQLVKA